jgi:hypothetical protein
MKSKVNDVCTLTMDGYKSSIRHFPVLIVVIVTKNGSKKKEYELATKYGHLSGYYNSKQLTYWENFTAEIIQINVDKLDKHHEMSVQATLQRFGNITGCHCQGNCSHQLKKCSCKAAGVL